MEHSLPPLYVPEDLRDLGEVWESATSEVAFPIFNRSNREIKIYSAQYGCSVKYFDSPIVLKPSTLTHIQLEIDLEEKHEFSYPVSSQIKAINVKFHYSNANNIDLNWTIKLKSPVLIYPTTTIYISESIDLNQPLAKFKLMNHHNFQLQFKSDSLKYAIEDTNRSSEIFLSIYALPKFRSSINHLLNVYCLNDHGVIIACRTINLIQGN